MASPGSERAGNPKAGIRRPKEGRNPKSEPGLARDWELLLGFEWE
jgi:hypothetical protein